MIAMTLAEIATVVGGVVDPAGSPEVRVSGAAFVDSRAAQPGGLFVAVVGERVDGHDFVAQALEAGAAAVLASRPVGAPAVLVTDVLGALGLLARHVVEQLADLRVVALTGSQGKTSTKDLVGGLLATHAPTVVTRGSFNNELGLPLTVLRADVDTRFLVLEMGARGIGHIAALCRTAPPVIGAVLNVGTAHVGEFGSRDAIAVAKGELVEALPATGTAVLNADDPLVAAMSPRTAARVLTFGETDGADVRLDALSLDADGCPGFTLHHAGQSADVQLHLLGEHQAANAAAAAAVALSAGMGLGAVAAGLSEATAQSRWRMEVRERADGVTVVNDAYNANPDSVRAALKTLVSLGRSRDARTVAVLGEMRELGASSLTEHDAVGRLVVRLDIAQLLVVGEAARPMHLGACLEGSWGEESVFVPDNATALAWLRDFVRPGDVVLVKASRAAALDEVAAGLLEEEPR